MQAFIKKVEKRQVESKNNVKFWVYDFNVAVVTNDKGDCKIYEHSMAKEFFEKYLAFCGYKDIKEIINAEVAVTTGVRTYVNNKGERKFIDVIKFMNFIDKDGNAIIMKNDQE